MKQTTLTQLLKKITACGTVAATLLLASAANAVEVAAPTTLDALTADGSNFILSPNGDFSFGEFTVSSVQVDGATAPLDADIQVSVAQTDTEVTLTFDIQANGDVTSPGAYDVALEYSATAVDALVGFVGHSLGMTGTATGTGSIVINEVIQNGDNEHLGTVSTLVNVPNLPDQLSESLAFGLLQSLTVQNKDIAVTSGVDGSASLVQFTQTFQTGIVPEPSTLILLILGGLGLGVTTRMARRKA